MGHASSPTRSPGVQHGRQLPEVSQQQELHVGVQPHAGQVRPERHVQLRDLLHHQPVQLLRAAPAHVPAHPVVGRLRPQTQVLRGAVRLGHQVHRLALLSQPRNNVVRARYVFPVPGRPVSSRELPARQWLIGSSTPFHLRCLGRSAFMRSARLPSNGFVSSTRRSASSARSRSAKRFGSRCVSRQSVFTCAR